MEDCETNATEVLVIMLSSLTKVSKWPIGYWFVNKIKSSVQSQLIRMALIEFKKFGIHVMSITCDGAYANLSTMQNLGCDITKTMLTLNVVLKLLQLAKLYTLLQMHVTMSN